MSDDFENFYAAAELHDVDLDEAYRNFVNPMIVPKVLVGDHYPIYDDILAAIFIENMQIEENDNCLCVRVR